MSSYSLPGTGACWRSTISSSLSSTLSSWSSGWMTTWRERSRSWLEKHQQHKAAHQARSQWQHPQSWSCESWWWYRWGHDNYPRPDLNGCQSRIYSWLQLAEASSFLTPTKMQYAHSLSKHPPGVQKKIDGRWPLGKNYPRIDLSGKERITFFATWIYENKNGNCYYIQLERELHLRQMYLHLDIFTPKMYLHQEDLHLDIFTPR